MRKIFAYVFALCLLLALPVSAAPAQPNWRELYYQLALEAFNAWDAALPEEGESWFNFIFQLLDLNKDGIPEFFVGLDYYAYADADDVAVYMIQDGQLRRFEYGPQDRQSAARYYTQYSEGDCNGGTVYKVTYYDFENCTRQASYYSSEKDMRRQIAEQTRRYGVAGSDSNLYLGECRISVTTWEDAVTARYHHMATLCRDEITSEADFRAAFMNLLEEQLAHPSGETEPYSGYPEPTTEPAYTTKPAGQSPVFHRYWIAIGIAGALLLCGGAVLLITKRAKRKEIV